MKRFSFRLETLLRHRKNLEEKERNELFRLLSALNQKCDELRRLEDKNHSTLLELSSRRMEKADHAEVSLFCAYLDRLQYEMGKCRQKISHLEQQIISQRSSVIEASKHKKVLETLKTRKEKEFDIQVDKVEQKAVDDLVVIRFPQKAR